MSQKYVPGVNDPRKPRGLIDILSKKTWNKLFTGSVLVLSSLLSGSSENRSGVPDNFTYFKDLNGCVMLTEYYQVRSHLTQSNYLGWDNEKRVILDSEDDGVAECIIFYDEVSRTKTNDFLKFPKMNPLIDSLISYSYNKKCRVVRREDVSVDDPDFLEADDLLAEMKYLSKHSSPVQVWVGNSQAWGRGHAPSHPGEQRVVDNSDFTNDYR